MQLNSRDQARCSSIVRAMAVGEISFADLLPVLAKELTIGLSLGFAMALATFARAWLLGVTPNIGLTVAISAGFIVVWAALIAAILPLALNRLGLDPAVASAPFVTTLVDGTGLFMYLTLARFLLGL